MNLKGFASSTKKASIRGPTAGLSSSPHHPGPGPDVGATAGDLWGANEGLLPQDEALGRAEARQSPTVHPTHPISIYQK